MHSSHHSVSVSVGDNWIQITRKAKPIKAKMFPKVTGKVKSITLSVDRVGRYWAKIVFDDQLTAPSTCEIKSENEVTGVAQGIFCDVATSDGQVHKNRYAARAIKNFERKAKKLKRKKKTSKNFKKAIKLFVKARMKIDNVRADFTKKLAKNLTQNYNAIALVGDSREPKERYDRRRIFRQEEFDKSLRSRAERLGKVFLILKEKIAEPQTCSGCGCSLALSSAVEHYMCPNCETVHHWDVEVAMDVKKRAIASLKRRMG